MKTTNKKMENEVTFAEVLWALNEDARNWSKKPARQSTPDEIATEEARVEAMFAEFGR